MSIKNNATLKPFRDYDEHDVVNLYALDGTGVAGTLVKVSSLDPDSESLYSSSYAVGATYDGVKSQRWVNPNKVAKAAQGDTASQVLGFTLLNVQETDENGQKLVLGHNTKINENSVVLSGQVVPVVTKGVFMLAESQWSGYNGGALAANDIAIAGDNGTLVAFTSYAELTGAGFRTDQIVGKFLSTSGSRNSRAAIFKLEL